MPFGNDPPIRPAHINTRYLDYWYWDYSSTEPYAGDQAGNFVRKTNLDVPMVSATTDGVATTWTSQPFLARPSIQGTITGYDLSVKLAAENHNTGPNNTYSASFEGFSVDIFNAFIWGLSALNNPIYVSNFGPVRLATVALNTVYTVTAQIRTTGTTYLIDGVAVPGSRAFTTDDMPDWVFAQVTLDNNDPDVYQAGGHEFRILVSA